MQNNNQQVHPSPSPFQSLIQTYDCEKQAIDEVIDTFTRLIISASMQDDPDLDHRRVMLSAQEIYKNLKSYAQHIA